MTCRTINLAKKIDPNARWVDHDTIGPFASVDDANRYVATIGNGRVIANGHGYNVSFHHTTHKRVSHSERASIREQAKQDIRDGMAIADVARKYNRTYVWAHHLKPKSDQFDRATYLKILSTLIRTNQRLITIANRLNVTLDDVRCVYQEATANGIPMKARD